MSKELDVRVVVEMGWKPRTVSEQPFGDGTFIVYDGPGGECMQPGVTWKLSEEIAKAWKVVEWMNREKKWIVQVNALWDGSAEAEIYTDAGTPSHWRDVADADSENGASEAICLAFLAAMEV